MAVSRRTFIRAAVASSAFAAVSAAELSPPAFAASPVGDVVGKITVGYQGWFAATGDGAPINGWWHWSQNWGQPPSPTNSNIVSWPDMREYTNAYPTAYASLGNGQPARLFSSYDQQTVNTHFAWMRDYGCDTAALQRFNPFGGEGPTRDAMAAKVRTAAEAFGRKFYVMYDVTNWTNMQAELKTDWTTKMSAHTASPAYARQNGKPVVCVWGFGFSDPDRPFGPTECLEVVNWFKAQGCYVIGGVPTWWRTGINDSRPGFSAVYHAFNMISPWMVGRASNVGDLDSYYNNANLGDQADCNASGIDYQPCVMPGDLSTGARFHGDFMWRHFYNMVRLGCQGIYISMFDEYNEGNQIAKTAENASMQPTNFGRRALDEDGVACSSDYYLRITNDGGKMLKGLIPLTAVRPTPPMVDGPPPVVPVNLALFKPMSASTSNGGFGAGNAVDNNPDTYWESANNAFGQWLQVDLGSVAAIGSIVLRLPASWGTRVQTLSVQAGSVVSTLSTVVGSAAYTFNPAAGNSVTIPLPAGTAARFVRIDVTGNTGWPAAQVSELQVWSVPTGTPPNTNLALNRPTAESSHTSGFGSGNAVNGDPNSYWESANNAFPQWLQVDLGATTSTGRLVVKLPPASAWATRTQTFSVQRSADGSTLSTVVGSAGYTFNPATGNAVTVTFPALSTRYVRLTFTANTGWPAGQVAELEVYAS
jgi:hypothetical protein